MAAGDHHDAHSSCSTAASEQSERRKRPPSNDEETSFKPYECRFCPMKFAKSQALGGHMNRHRQEREREQVVQARQLLMQQEFSSSLLMSGQNPSSALPKLSHAHLSRSASEGCLKDGMCMGTPPFNTTTAYRGVYNPSLGPPSVGWNLGNVADASQNSELPAFALDGGIVPPYQNRQAYCSSGLHNNTPYLMPQPLNRAHSQHDMMLSVPYDKAMQLSMYPLDPNTPPAQRSSSLPPPQNQAEEASIMAGSSDVAPNLLPSNRSSVHQRSSDMKNAQFFSQASSLQSQQHNVGAVSNGFQFFMYPGSECTRSSLDFNPSSINQLDGLPWTHANAKSAHTFNMLTTANDEYHHHLENSEQKMDDGSLTISNGEQAKTTRWDLALPRPDNVDEESKMRDLTPVGGGVSTPQFDTNYENMTTGAEEKESINEENDM